MPLRPALILPLLAILAFAAACTGGGSNGSSTSTPGSGSSLAPGTNVSPGGTTEAGPVELKLDTVLSGFTRPTFVTSTGIEGDDRLFVVEKSGLIRIVKDGAILPTPFLDAKSFVNSSANEQGLLGLAFHPGYATNGRYFIAYTALGAGANTLAELRVSSNPDVSNPGPGTVLLAIDDFASNHNGGMLAFGPDGYLYMSTGDGGQGGDPKGNGQDKNALLAKILRLDVTNVPAGQGYGIPATNPFANGGGRAEAWAYGLRNPWRFSFDRETGDLYLPDVGQNAVEEVNVQPAASKGGENYGWNVVEGDRCYNGSSCNRDGFTAPVAVYSHDDGCSITGGYVYRGAEFPRIAGLYFYADYCSGTVWAMEKGSDGKYISTVVLEDIESITSWGEDSSGEVYAVDDDGNLRHLTATTKVVSQPSSSGGEGEAELVKLTVSSPRIEEGKTIPPEITCDGDGKSPQVSWNPIPPRARSYVLLLDDVSNKEKPQSQWVLFNIPSVVNYLPPEVPEGEMLGAGPILQGKNGDGKVTYDAPCPDNGKEQTYRFTAYALDINLTLKGGASRDEVMKAMEGHVVAQGELTAKYKGR